MISLKITRQGLCMALSVAILSFVALPKVAQSSGPVEALVPKVGVEPFPDGCGNPYFEPASFLNFYQATLNMMVVKRGPAAPGVAELYAVAELRSELNSIVPNPSEESAIDRLIMTQLCNFRKINTGTKLQANIASKDLMILSTSEALHEHLIKLAPKLYKDSRAYVVSVMAARARAREQEDLLASRWGDIRRARENGRSKIRDLFE
jgi:hypothetical protein